MKKILIFAHLIIFTVIYSHSAFADHDDWDDDDGYIAQPQVNYYYPAPQVNNYYPQPQVNNYYPQPPINNYYPRPQVNNYPPQNPYDGYRGPSTQGLAGGVIGSVLGYQWGSGNPLVSGLGATAGAFLGNGYRNYQGNYYRRGYGYPRHHHFHHDDDDD